MQAAGTVRWAERSCGAAKVAALLCGLLAACAADRPHWMDQATLIIRPSHHQAVFAYSFGGEPGAREETNALVGRNVAASIAAATVVQDSPLPSLDTVDFKGGRLLIHPPRNH